MSHERRNEHKKQHNQQNDGSTRGVKMQNPKFSRTAKLILARQFPKGDANIYTKLYTNHTLMNSQHLRVPNIYRR